MGEGAISEKNPDEQSILRTSFGANREPPPPAASGSNRSQEFDGTGAGDDRGANPPTLKVRLGNGGLLRCSKAIDVVDEALSTFFAYY